MKTELRIINYIDYLEHDLTLLSKRYENALQPSQGQLPDEIRDDYKYRITQRQSMIQALKWVLKG